LKGQTFFRCDRDRLFVTAFVTGGDIDRSHSLRSITFDVARLSCLSDLGM